ncbi:hypothetical protein ACH5RR_030620 [Cinchona calisaya]|uniref:CLAVATA3/ESR (CLE)-related protein 25 n=1 Tax=Cinchona calisaya TaxID=153742 RepID=A0ABD2YWH1_9GENT
MLPRDEDMNCRGRGSGRWCSKALFFQLLLSLGFIWFLRVGATTLNAEVAAGGITKHTELVGKRHHLNAHKNLEINFVSKRRVPNGPDPIHNRKAGNSHRPPGRA